MNENNNNINNELNSVIPNSTDINNSIPNTTIPGSIPSNQGVSINPVADNNVPTNNIEQVETLSEPQTQPVPSTEPVMESTPVTPADNNNSLNSTPSTNVGNIYSQSGGTTAAPKKKSTGVIVGTVLLLVAGAVGAYFALKPSSTTDKTNTNTNTVNNKTNNNSSKSNTNSNSSTKKEDTSGTTNKSTDSNNKTTTDEAKTEKSFEDKKVDEISPATWEYEKLDLTDLQWVKSERYGSMQIPASWPLYTELYEGFEGLDAPLDAIVYNTADNKNSFIMMDSIAADSSGIFEKYLTTIANNPKLEEYSQTVKKVGNKNAVIITSKYDTYIASTFFIANKDNSKLIQITFQAEDPAVVSLFDTFTFE